MRAALALAFTYCPGSAGVVRVARFLNNPHANIVGARAVRTQMCVFVGTGTRVTRTREYGRHICMHMRLCACVCAYIRSSATSRAAGDDALSSTGTGINLVAGQTHARTHMYAHSYSHMRASQSSAHISPHCLLYSTRVSLHGSHIACDAMLFIENTFYVIHTHDTHTLRLTQRANRKNIHTIPPPHIFVRIGFGCCPPVVRERRANIG